MAEERISGVESVLSEEARSGDRIVDEAGRVV
jgi:hypothetical protein